MAQQDFEDGMSKLDVKLLERLIKETARVIDRNGARAVYYIPLDKKYTDACQYIFAKHGVKLEQYQSGINPYPVLKITHAQIDQLSPDAQKFLFAVNVDPKKLEQRLDQIMLEMKSKTK